MGPAYDYIRIYCAQAATFPALYPGDRALVPRASGATIPVTTRRASKRVALVVPTSIRPLAVLAPSRFPRRRRPRRRGGGVPLPVPVGATGALVPVPVSPGRAPVPVTVPLPLAVAVVSTSPRIAPIIPPPTVAVPILSVRVTTTRRRASRSVPRRGRRRWRRRRGGRPAGGRGRIEVASLRQCNGTQVSRAVFSQRQQASNAPTVRMTRRGIRLRPSARASSAA